MKTKRLFSGLLVLTLMLGAATQAQADDKRRGTAGAQYLLLTPTARLAGLGTGLTGGLADLNGIEALYANPAGLALNTGTTALFSRTEYVADIGVNYFGVGQRFGSNNIALTINAWDLGDIPLTDETSPEVQEGFTYNAPMITVGASYARQFTDRIAAGVTAKLLSERIDNMNATGVAFDAGMMYVAGESGLRFGVSLKNFGPEMSYGGTGLIRSAVLPEQEPGAAPAALNIDADDYELPSLLNFGAAYTAEFGAGTVATVTGNFRSNSFSQPQYGAGLELGFRELVYVRGGYQFEEDMDLTMWQGYNVGGGLNLDFAGTRLAVDYAYRGVDYFDAVHVITAAFTL